MGGGRSGTTLLDIILGNAEDAFSTGEIHKFPKLKGCPHGFEQGSPNFAFWKKVEQALFDSYKDQPVDYKGLRKLTRKLEYHSNFWLNYVNWISSGKRKVYATYVNRFFDALFGSIDEPLVIDSSKYPTRALSLYRHLDYSIHFIYLIRHPVGVVTSFAKKDLEQPPKNYFQANLFYFVINLFNALVCRKIGKDNFIKVRYDDLLAEPVKELTRIQEKFGIDLSRPKDLIAAGQPLSVGYFFEGNRIRLQESIRLKQKKASYPANIKNTITRLFNRLWWP